MRFSKAKGEFRERPGKNKSSFKIVLLLSLVIKKTNEFIKSRSSLERISPSKFLYLIAYSCQPYQMISINLTLSSVP